MYFNCRSVLPKHDELVALCLSNKPDIVCLVETWLSADVLVNEVAIPHYSLIRLDRNRHGGGVAIYVHSSILFDVLLVGPAGLELIVVSLIRNNCKLCLCVFYRPPSSSCSEILDSLCEALFIVDISHFSNFLLLGDFNVDFNNPSCHLYSHVSNLMNTFSLSQVVDTPTDCSHNGHPSLIDLVFVLNINRLLECTVIPPLSNSDHLGLSVTLQHCHMIPQIAVRRKVWRYKHANFERANDMICDLDLDEILVRDDIKASWSNLKHTFLNVMESCIPNAVIPTRHNLPWLNKEIVQLIRKRNLLFRRAHKSGNRDDQEKFKQLRYRVVSKLRSAKTKFFTNLHPHNTKDFWKLVKSVKPRSSTFPTIELGDIVATSDLEKASLLNDVFINSFNLSTPVLDVSDLPTTDPSECPESWFCTEDEVYEMLSTLDATKSSGHSEISAWMLKETALSMTPAVTQLFIISISLGELPDE